MTELSRRHKNNHNAMRNAAIGALLGVIGVCALFLVIALPLRALQEHPVDNRGGAGAVRMDRQPCGLPGTASGPASPRPTGTRSTELAGVLERGRHPGGW